MSDNSIKPNNSTPLRITSQPTTDRSAVIARTGSASPVIPSTVTAVTTPSVVVIRTINPTSGTNKTFGTGNAIKVTPVGPHPMKIPAVPAQTSAVINADHPISLLPASASSSSPYIVQQPAVSVISIKPASTVVSQCSATPYAPTDIASSRMSAVISPSSSVKPQTSVPSTSSLSSGINPGRRIIREMQVRVPNRKDKRFSVLRFHTADRVDLSSGIELFMQRENNLKQFRSVQNLSEAPDRGAGSEFGREAKDEARRKKFGIVRETYRPDDQPWIMTVGKGRTGKRRFKGVREGNVSDNVQYFVFCQCKDGNFDAYPVHAWYKMKPEINYRFLREDEAEVEYSRLNKTMNLFNVMIKRKLTDGVEVEEGVALSRELGKELRYLSVASEGRSNIAESEWISTVDSKGTKFAGKTTNRKSQKSLRLTDLDELGSASEADEEEEEEEDANDAETKDATDTIGRSAGSGRNVGSGSLFHEMGELSKSGGTKSIADRARQLRQKQRAVSIVSRMRRGVKKRKRRMKKDIGSSSEDADSMDEAHDESEIDDREGDEVDYMTASSSNEENLPEEERERIYEETSVADELALRALLTDISSDEDEDKTGTDADNTVDETDPDFQKQQQHRRRQTEVADKIGEDVSVAAAGAVGSNEGVDHGNRSHRNRKGNKMSSGKRHSSSSSSSSSSSLDEDDGDSSTYSSSSDSELDPDEQAKKRSKKAAVLQKISDSIHGSTGSALSDPADSHTSTLKRRLTDNLGQDSSESPTPPAMKRSRSDTPSSVLSDSIAVSAGSSSSSRGNVPVNDELTNTVRKYLMRKPITVTELIKKIRLRRLVGKNEDAQLALANVLRQLRPIKQIINGQHALSLKH